MSRSTHCCFEKPTVGPNRKRTPREVRCSKSFEEWLKDSFSRVSLIAVFMAIARERFEFSHVGPVVATKALSTLLLYFGTALADLELWVALADHVNTTATLYDLAIRVAVFEGSNATNYFHRIDLLIWIG